MTVPAAYAIQSLLDKMSNPDCDFRFMSLNDLLGMLTQNTNFSQTDPATMSKLTDAVVKALDDANGEVQNLAVKWYGLPAPPVGGDGADGIQPGSSRFED
jgi:cullin-associated NEDD8-dissociated protein 1